MYEKVQQPTMESWLKKTQVMTMLTQTREKKDNTPKVLSRDDEAKAETTRAMEKKTRSYPREARAKNQEQNQKKKQHRS